MSIPTSPNSISNSPSIRYPSLTALQAVHNGLLQLQRQEADAPAFLAEVAAFLHEGAATGALLDADADRRTAQGLLDYWVARLYRVGEEPPDATLAEFDPALAPELPAKLCPYLGLDAFHEVDGDKFFGRNELIARLIERLTDQRLLAVVGPSGSGKSSLVRAGLIPALQAGALQGSQDWRYLLTIVPGSDPLASLAQLLRPRSMQPACPRCGKPVRSGQKFCPMCGTPLVANARSTAEGSNRPPIADPTAHETLRALLSAPPSLPTAEQIERIKQDPQYLARHLEQQPARPAVLVVDQFEEVFTLCKDEHARKLFIANLLTLATALAPPHRVILTMRQDFETYVGQAPELEELFKAGRMPVTPLSAGEMRDAIEQPAERVGLKFEAGIVDGLLQDILGEPAGLPLLQFTLLKLWEQRERNRVTLKAYEQVGGGRLALARSADDLYGKLIPEDQQAAKRILLRMIQPGEGLEVTSRRIRRDDLARIGEDPGRIEHVLARLIESRLVRLTAGETRVDDQIEVAHEALVRNWPKLVDWLNEERDRLRQRARLTTAAQQWQDNNCDPDRLWRGAALSEVLSYKDLSDLESEFVKESLAVERREIDREQVEKKRLRRIQKLAIGQALLTITSYVGIAVLLAMAQPVQYAYPFFGLLGCFIPIFALIVLALSLGGIRIRQKSSGKKRQSSMP